MLPPAKTARAVLLLAALLQLSLPGAAAWADARLDGSGAGAVAHVESRSTDRCARIHPSDCALHRFLSAPVAVGQAVRVGVLTLAAVVPVSASRSDAPALVLALLPDSRAPPTRS
jgi:hypothetical protein